MNQEPEIHRKSRSRPRPQPAVNMRSLNLVLTSGIPIGRTLITRFALTRIASRRLVRFSKTRLGPAEKSTSPPGGTRLTSSGPIGLRSTNGAHPPRLRPDHGSANGAGVGTPPSGRFRLPRPNPDPSPARTVVLHGRV